MSCKLFSTGRVDLSSNRVKPGWAGDDFQGLDQNLSYTFPETKTSPFLPLKHLQMCFLKKCKVLWMKIKPTLCHSTKTEW